jgi:hypothetical protein
MVELAIVLFVIGLILGSVLLGNQLINSAHVKRLADDFRNIPMWINLYRDRFRAPPGDNPQVVVNLGIAAHPGNGNGVIDGNWYDTGATSEASRAWQHLRLAGLVDGETDVAAPNYTPLNAIGKPIGFQSGTSDPSMTPIRTAQGNALLGTYIVCSRGIPGKLVQSLDIKLDDGSPATGSMLATPDTGDAYNLGASAATAIQNDQSYILCMGY